MSVVLVLFVYFILFTDPVNEMNITIYYKLKHYWRTILGKIAIIKNKSPPTKYNSISVKGVQY